ncbi:alpha/beta fold hydrolase BchO [Xylophilus sp. ASV27]|uniref:alpha/beta fold hydrolase BchO n=1 Tax=Xylophilus sp. ASV27 TaxID=2795129 RepID=UPI0018EBD847|nr:alpha/beta fold hydrolase BchO [Xylophilus sp. ASV27]
MSRALDWDVAGLDWPHRQHSSFVQAAGIRWHVQRMGSGPVLLLLHGTGAASHSWRDLMPLLAQEFTCVALDLPGHGFTSAPHGMHMSLDGMARALTALLARLQVRPALIVGHSAGAAIAAQLCLREHIDADAVLALNGAFLPFAGLAGLVLPQAARAMALNSVAARLFAWGASDAASVRRLIASTGSTLDARGEALYARLVGNPVHVAAALGMMARWNVAPLLARLPALGERLHLMAGALDRAVPPSQAQRVQRLVPGASLALLEGAGHLAHEEMPVRVAAWVLDVHRICLQGVARRA